MKKIIMIASVVMVLSGCTSMTKEQQGMMSGTAIGAGAGAGFAELVGGKTSHGLAIGAAMGLIIGNIIGAEQEKQQ